MPDTESTTVNAAEQQESAEAAEATEAPKPAASTEDALREAIRNEVYDPELGLNIVDLGLIYDITIADNKADITMTLTSPGCPVGPELVTNVRRSLSVFDDIDEVDVHVVFSPPWHPTMMSEEAKDELGYFG